MAYIRSDILPKAAEVMRKLSHDGRQPPVGDVVQAVVDAGICGRGVAQQLVAELRKSGAPGPSEADDGSHPDETLGDDIKNLLKPLDDLHRRIDEVRVAVGQGVADSISQIKATLGTVIADQGVAGKRADEDSRAEIARLETELVTAQERLAEARTKVEEGEHQRAELYARLIETGEIAEAYRTQIDALEAESQRHLDHVKTLQDNLDGCRRDLAANREAEAGLRAELRRLSAEAIARPEYEALQNQFAGTNAALAQERERNAELHAQVLRLVGAMSRPTETTTALPA